MAPVAKSTKGVSPATTLIPNTNKDQHLLVTENVRAGDACTITATGIRRAMGADVVHGFALTDADVAAEESVTLFHDVVVRYGDNLTGGTPLYLSASVPGGLDTTAAGAVIAFVLDKTRVRLLRSY